MYKIKKFPPERKNLKIRNIFANLRSKQIQTPKPVTLPKINGLTLEEIEKKYGKL
jgi:hypothetical protein